MTLPDPDPWPDTKAEAQAVRTEIVRLTDRIVELRAYLADLMRR